MKVLLTVCCSLICFTAFCQQRPDPAIPQGENLEVPENWNVRLDHPSDEVIIGSNPDSSDIYFVNMTPGWHITTGPAAIFYHPANTAEGDYEVSTSIYFFNPGDRNREAYGLIFGGRNLEVENQEYLYFLVRNTGEYLIKRRLGEETFLVQDWTESEAITKYENTEEPSVKNELSVDVAGETLRFSINEEEVTEINSDGLNTNGIFGLRINHSINSHIADLRLEEN